MPAGESLQDEEDDDEDDDNDDDDNDEDTNKKPVRGKKDRQSVVQKTRSTEWKKQRGAALIPTPRYPEKINLNDCLKGSPDHEKRRRFNVGPNCNASASEQAEKKKTHISYPPRRGRRKAWAVGQIPGTRAQRAGSVPWRLALVGGEAVVEVLAGGRLAPLLVGLLATAVATSARRTAVAHGLRAVAGGRLGLGATIARLLARTIRTYTGELIHKLGVTASREYLPPYWLK